MKSINNKLKKSFVLLGIAVAVWGCGTENLNTAVENGAKKLSGHDIRILLTNSTVKSTGYGEEAEIKYLQNGKLSAKNNDQEKDTGLWQIDNQERLCLKFKNWGQGDKICFQVYQEGKEYKQFNTSGLLAYTFTVTEQGRQFQEGISYTAPKTKETAQAINKDTDFTSTQGSLDSSPPKSPTDIHFIIKQHAQNCPGCNLAKAELAGANLLNANLEGANLAEANLRDALLRRANLKGANLYKSNLQGADLSGADLTGANLTDAILTGARLTGTKLPAAK